MTSGTKIIDKRYPAGPCPPGMGTYPAGRVISRTWSGQDAISATVPRSSYPRAKRPKDMTKKGAAPRGKVLLPPKPYTASIQDYVDNPYVYWDTRYSRAQGTATQSQLNDPWSGGFPSYDPAQEYKLLEKLRSKVYGSGFNPAVFSAEANQAFRMISDTARRLRLGISSLIKRDWRGVYAAWGTDLRHTRKVVLDPKKSMGDRWLELQYGWFPLVSDLEAAGKWVAEQLIDTSNSRFTRVVARRDFPIFEEKSSSQLTGYNLVWRRRVTIVSLQYVIYGLQRSPAYVPSLATVATVLHEKTPWSFIADWVVPIGSYLAALRTAADIKGTVVKTVTKRVVYTDWTSGKPYVQPLYPVASVGGPSKKMISVVRTVSSEINPPAPWSVNDSPLSWRRAANAVALLAQRKW